MTSDAETGEGAASGTPGAQESHGLTATDIGLLVVVALAAVALIAVAFIRRRIEKTRLRPLVCEYCGTLDPHPTSQLPGSGATELLLWLCLAVPGLIYTTWRRYNRPPLCRLCGSPKMIRADSPEGQKLSGGRELPQRSRAARLPGFTPPSWEAIPQAERKR